MSGVFAYRELLLELTSREIKQRYKQSILGYAWVILNPFFQMLVMSFVFSKIIRFDNIGTPYTLYIYIGLLTWNLLANSLNSSVLVLVANASLLTKVYFPRELFVQSTIFAKLVDFFLACSIFIVFLIAYKVPLTAHMLWFFPILLVQLTLTYGFSLLAAAFNLFYRDIQYVLTLALMIWMYLTPVIYPTSIFPDRYQWIFLVNPMSTILTAYRDSLLFGKAPDLPLLGITFLIAIAFSLLAHKIFKKLEGTFADVV